MIKMILINKLLVTLGLKYSFEVNRKACLVVKFIITFNSCYACCKSFYNYTLIVDLDNIFYNSSFVIHYFIIPERFINGSLQGFPWGGESIDI